MLSLPKRSPSFVFSASHQKQTTRRNRSRNHDDDESDDQHQHQHQHQCHHHHHHHHHHHEKNVRMLCENGHLDEAMEALYHDVHMPLPVRVYLSLLKACCKNKALHHAKHVYEHINHHHVQISGFLGDFLVMTLAKCGAISDASHISETLSIRTVFSWTAIIASYAENGCGIEALEAYECMLRDGVEPNSYTFVSLFRACGDIPDLVHGQRLHEEARRRNLLGNIFVANTLISMYGKCSALSHGEELFSDLSERDVVSWNSMLSAYVENKRGKHALRLFRQMQEEGYSRNKQTIILAIQACNTLVQDLTIKSSKQTIYEIGRSFHALARKKLGYISDALVGTALLQMYGSCGTVSEAENAFNVLSDRDIVSWTALLSAYLEQGQARKALHLFRLMQEEDMEPNQLTFGIVLQACHILIEEVAEEEAPFFCGRSSNASLDIGRALHADALKKGYTYDLIVGNPLISMYSKCNGPIEEAEAVFGALVYRNIPSWNVMLSAYVERGESEKALELYKQMQKENVSPNELTFVGLLQACSDLGSVDMCKKLHFTIVSVDHDTITSLMATLIHTYGSCACMEDAQIVFNNLVENPLVLWNACIAGYTGEGDCISSLRIYEDLKLRGIDPDEVTFTSFLSSCSHSGHIRIGLGHFAIMKSDYFVNLDSKHYGIIVDLVGRAGDFKTLERILEKIPKEADLAMWLCVLNACRIHGNIEVAKKAFNRVMHLSPKKSSAYVLMSNIYADAE